MRPDDVIARAVTAAAEKAAGRAMRPKSETLPARYIGRDGQGKDWVLLPGASSPTPVRRMAVEAAEGDTVSVAIGDGRAVVDSNVTNPSAGLVGVRAVGETANGAKSTAEGAAKDAAAAIDYATSARAAADDARAQADAAMAGAERADTAARSAIGDAERAYGAAEQAIGDAGRAHDAADSAQASADAAQGSAEAAQGSAESAQASADAATKHLSDVENVVGTVNWIAEHGRYVSQEGEDFDESRCYYSRSGSGTQVDPYVYTVVESPVAEDMGSYYLLDVTESVQAYVNSHIWIDSNGLNVSSENSEEGGKAVRTGWRIGDVFEMLRDGASWFKLWIDGGIAKTRLGRYDRGHIELGAGGMEVLGNDGESLSSFSAGGVVIGKEDELHATVSQDGLVVTDANAASWGDLDEAWNAYAALTWFELLHRMVTSVTDAVLVDSSSATIVEDGAVKAVLSGSGVTFFDGLGTAASNVKAVYGAAGVTWNDLKGARN